MVYDDLLEKYKNLHEENIGLAFEIRQEATVLRSSYGETMCNNEKEMIDAKNTATAIKAKKSIEYSAKPTEGNRKAEQDSEYIDAMKLYSLKLKQFKYSEVQYNILKDIAYHANAMYEIANKQVRR